MKIPSIYAQDDGGDDGGGDDGGGDDDSDGDDSEGGNGEDNEGSGDESNQEGDVGGNDGEDNNLAEVFGGNSGEEISEKDEGTSSTKDAATGEPPTAENAGVGESVAFAPENTVAEQSPTVAAEGTAAATTPVTGTTPVTEETNCNPSYEGACVPMDKPDYDCDEIGGKDIKVIGDDNSDLDKDNDKIACELGNNDDYIGEIDDDCHPSYPGACIPTDKPDFNCDDTSDTDIILSSPSEDQLGLDGDGDGIGCESDNDDYKGKTIRLGDRDIYNYKKIIKYTNSKCTTQTTSISLVESIGPRTPVLVGDFYPCELTDGRATLNLPNNPNLYFAIMHLDKKNNDHEGIIVQMDKIQNLNKNNALFIVDFNDKMQGKDPRTGKTKTLENINAIALFNRSQQTIDFNSGNSLAISAVLKS